MSNTNPYAPPTAPHANENGPRFFTPTVIAIHTLFFPWLGSAFAAINFRRLGDRAASLRAILVYLVPSAVIHFIAGTTKKAALELGFHVLGIVLAIILYREQQAAVGPRLAAGAPRARWYPAWVVVFAILVVWQFLSPTPPH